MRMSAKEVKSESEVQGTPRPKPGRYHAIINHAKWGEKDEWADGKKTGNKIPFLAVEFAVLNGTIPGQEKTTLPEKFFTSEKAEIRLLRLALASGILQPGEERDVDFENELSGKQLIIEVDEDEYEKDGQKKKISKLTFLGLWSVFNPEQKEVPRDQQMMQAAISQRGNGMVSANGAVGGVAGGGNGGPANGNGGHTNGNGNGNGHQQPAASGANGGGDKKWDF